MTSRGVRMQFLISSHHGHGGEGQIGVSKAFHYDINSTGYEAESMTGAVPRPERIV